MARLITYWYAEVGAPVPARVTRLLVNAGDAVRAGQTLAELTSPELGRERAEYLSASARLKLAEAALERKRGLAAEKSVPLREVQEAESAVGEARAALRASRAATAAFGVEPPADEGDSATSSAFVLRSPVAGSVIERTAVIGQMLDPATPAFRNTPNSPNVLALTLNVDKSIGRPSPARKVMGLFDATKAIPSNACDCTRQSSKSGYERQQRPDG